MSIDKQGIIDILRVLDQKNILIQEDMERMDFQEIWNKVRKYTYEEDETNPVIIPLTHIEIGKIKDLPALTGFRRRGRGAPPGKYATEARDEGLDHRRRRVHRQHS